MANIKVTYNNSEIINEEEDLDQVDVSYNGSTLKSFTDDGSATLSTSGKIANSNIVVGNKTLLTNAKLLVSNIVVTVSDFIKGLIANLYSDVPSSSDGYNGQYAFITTPITIPSQAKSLTYNGSSQTVTMQGVSKNSVFVSGDTSGTNAGTYSVIYALADSEHYKGTDNTKTNQTVNGIIDKMSLTIPACTKSNGDYTGSTVTPTGNNYNTAYMTIGGTYSATALGTYTATFTLKDTANTQWSDGTTSSKSISWSIVEKVEDGLTYDTAYSISGTGSWIANVMTTSTKDPYRSRYTCWYNGTCTSSGTYYFQSTAAGTANPPTTTSDTYGQLWSASSTPTSSNRLTYNDDGAGSTQFKMSYSCTAGQSYYVVVQMYSNQSSTYYVNWKIYQ